MPSVTALADKSEKKKLSDYLEEIQAMDAQLAEFRKAGNGDRKAISKLTGVPFDKASFSDSAGALREKRIQLERQRQQLQARASAFSQSLQSKQVAKAAAAYTNLPVADQETIRQIKENPEGARQALAQMEQNLMSELQSGVDGQKAIRLGVELRAYAAAMDAAIHGEGTYVAGLDDPNANAENPEAASGKPGRTERTASKLVNSVLPAHLAKLNPGLIEQLAPQTPRISAVPTEGEEQAAVGLADSMRRAAPMPEPVPNVPGEGLADTLQRIAPAGNGALTAPPGEQLVFRSAPGGGIEAGSAAIGTPGSEQFTSGFRPNAELTQRIQMPTVDQAAPGSQPAPETGPVAAAPPPPTDNVRRLAETGSIVSNPETLEPPSFARNVGEQVGRLGMQATSLPLRAVGSALAPLSPLGRGLAAGVLGSLPGGGGGAPAQGTLPPEVQARVDAQRAAQAQAAQAPAPAQTPAPAAQPQAQAPSPNPAISQRIQELIQSGVPPAQVAQELAQRGLDPANFGL